MFKSIWPAVLYILLSLFINYYFLYNEYFNLPAYFSITMPVDTSLYELLNVSPNSSDHEIKKAYRKLAKDFHPDKNPGHEEMFKEVTFAYDVLSDPDKRKMYDRFGMQAVKEQGGGFSTGGMDDIFSHFFGGGGGGHPFEDFFGGGMGRRRGPRRGKDSIQQHRVSLEDLYNGHKTKISVKKTVICKKCNGLGGKAGSTSTCSTCRGRGIEVQMRQIGPGMVQQIQQQCSSCHGMGTMIKEKDRCKTCAGRKITNETKNIEVQVEKGMRHGEKLVFHGEGDQMPDVETGDLIVAIIEQPHEKFERQGANLIIKHTITLTEALTGFHFHIQHLDKRVIDIASPPGYVVKPGQILAVEDEGMPRRSDPYSRGFLFVKFDVEFPDPHFTSEELYKKLEVILGPRIKYPPIPTEHEEAHLMDFDVRDSGVENHASQSDSDDDMCGARTQQCQTA